MGQPKSDDVGTPIFDQLAREIWPEASNSSADTPPEADSPE
jgi:hypothetical protein